ncbi:class I SAM-dependent methyltransferase [Dactylosporangium siamense]|uniref:SAM-dependent methyltransferase n=1 Tax=Dactylosporangium siamense TaxID=685454 RepID=A0A919PQZ4_9ACTN|nr:class I SAM-dependent methyltransferase [Dactylosporangium siamense]GIG48622.1 SAM-dependent methyltransferase [Dactylosporangium siamense]
MGEDTRESWDAHAATFDDEADHGLRDPAVRAAWAALLTPVLPPAPAAVLDAGCGTGSIATLLAEAGYHVHGVDSSPGMLDVAREKAARHAVAVDLVVGDAADPPFEPARFDVVLTRHVLWALPDPGAVLDRWIALLRPGGTLVLIEGRWSTGAGITAADCVSLVRGRREQADVRMLTDETLWGKPVTDERYLLLSRV